MRKCFFLAFLGVLIVAGFAEQPALADDVYAKIRGVVTDASGAVVPEAQVQATNKLTGLVKTTTTQQTGLYEFLQLPIGTYAVTASKQGFKTFKSTEFTLTVNQVYNLPVELQVGAASETVEVRAQAVQVESTNIQMATVINAHQISQLPLLDDDFTQLEKLAPGVMNGNDRFGTFSVNGSQTQQSAFVIDGTDANDIALNTPMLLPNTDAIQEFNLISSTINPEFGRNSGGIVNALIKSGTNSFHGTASWEYRDTFMNTHSFFHPTAPIFHRNVLSGTVGGPIWKNKTFFFVSYKGLRSRQPQDVATNTVFSPAQRTGDFSNDLGSLTTQFTGGAVNSTPIPLAGDDGVLHAVGTPWFGVGNSGSIFNCGTATVDASGNVTACSNPNFGKIGIGGFNSVSAGLLKNFVPLPNGPNSQFFFNPQTVNKQDQTILKIDHNINQSNQIWGTMVIDNAPQTNDLPFLGGTLPGFAEVDNAYTKQFTVAWNHQFGSTMLNEARLGYARLRFDAVQPLHPALPASAGFTGISPQDAAGAGLPVIGVTGFFNLGFSADGPQPRKDQNYQFTDNFSKIAGKHSLKFGFDVRRFQVDNPFFFQNNGNFSFGGVGAFSSGDPAVDFMLGIPDSYTQNTGGVINARAYEYYSYGQDTWKVRSNLALTFGSGWDIETPYRNNQFGGLAFNCFKPGAQSTVFPTAPQSILFPGDAGCQNGGATTRFKHLAPRFGFVWAPNLGPISGGPNKFSIRGGFGIYYNRFEEETALQNLGAPPFGLGSSGAIDFNPAGQPGFATPFTDLTTGTAFANKFPFVGPAAGSTTFNFALVEPFALNTIDPNLTTPYSMNFNLNIQREFAGNTVVTLGYVGSQARHLYRSYEANPITSAGQAACLANPACIAFRVIQHALFPTHSVADGSLFHTVAEQHTDGNSGYNSLQLNVNKGLSHGLSLITSYTWSHAIDNASGFENSTGSGSAARNTNIFQPALNVGDSAFDARQRLVLGYIYQIPSLHKVANWAPDRVVGGWKFTGITTFQGGFPGNIGDSSFRSLFCDGLNFFGGCPDNATQVGTLKTLDPHNAAFNRKRNYFFDPNTFTHNAFGSFGNVGRDSFHGPGFVNTDFTIGKDTKVAEGKTLQLRLEGYNVFNHTNFAIPNTDRNDPRFGRVLSTVNGNANDGNGRLVQIGAKFIF